MLDISNKNIITMTRGDNETIPLKLFTDNYKKKYIFFPNQNDKIFFALMEPNQTFENAIVKKVFGYKDVDKENGVINIKLDSIDTEFLASGDYYYTIKILRKDSWKEEDDDQGTVETLVDRTKFIIVDSIRESQLPDLSMSDVNVNGTGYIINEDGSIRIISNGFRTILSVNISGKEGNLLRKEDDGLYAYLDTSDFATKSGDIKHLQDEIDETNTKLSDVEEDVESIHQDISEVKEDISGLHDDIEEVKENYATKSELLETEEELRDAIDLKQDKLTAGTGITIEDNVISSSVDYNDLNNKPSINNVELTGNKSLEDLGIDIPDHTSQLINDGQDGIHPYITDQYHDDTKQDVIDDLDEIRSGAALGSTSIQPGDNVSELVNDSGYLVEADLSEVAKTGDYDDLINKPEIPSALSDLTSDSTHRTVSDSQIAEWDDKQNKLTAGQNITISEVVQPDQSIKTIISASGGGSGSGNVYQDTTANWNSQVQLISEEGAIYVYTDYNTIDGQDVGAVKIGDGRAYLIDLPFITGPNNEQIQAHIENNIIHITQAEREAWNNKVRCFISSSDPNNLVFTTN